MTGFDIAVLVIAGIFVIIGAWRGFLRTVLRIGASVAAVILSRLLGGALGIALFPELIGADSAIGQRLPSTALDNVNRSLAVTIGTLAVFILALIVLRLVVRAIAGIALKDFKSNAVDKLLGAVLGLLIALGAIYVLAFAIDVIAVVITFVAPSSDIYEIIEGSVIFKYFF